MMSEEKLFSIPEQTDPQESSSPMVLNAAYILESPIKKFQCQGSMLGYLTQILWKWAKEWYFLKLLIEPKCADRIEHVSELTILSYRYSGCQSRYQQ